LILESCGKIDNIIKDMQTLNGYNTETDSSDEVDRIFNLNVSLTYNTGIQSLNSTSDGSANVDRADY
jgi:hypothetical protein